MAAKQHELATDLERRIAAGEFSETNKLPTEDQLIEQYGASRYCVRGAIAVLAEAGEVFPVRGSGVFVREDRGGMYMPISTSYGIAADFPDRKVVSTVRELALTRTDEKLAKRMRCDVDAPVWRVVRLRCVDDLPISYETAWYLKEYVPFLNEEIASGSLYRYMREDLGLRFGFTDKVIHVDWLGAEAARQLGLEEGDPAICIEDDAFLSNGKLFNASYNLYHYKNAKFYSMASMR
ncbi:GntR family transcriptional regulator [Bifidobacterium imperatoris]|uniref:GntR family transcriptional regulator n=1 Tax=Bifidobacterium imperatoris TaxID=2020965 RepID=A0A2N5IV05_9BIFI|nr:GntR family transcriptional regulator [Bifidobacterium imperatoris]PLS25790.1 GntR family transcriptional regulator [Bifidobacterium imperatoris]QSY57910.1 GntR family transcriptional regulator [Bifidobacterium imperatoris]